MANFSHAAGPACSSLFSGNSSVGSEFQGLLSLAERFEFSWEQTPSYKDVTQNKNAGLKEFFEHTIQYHESAEFKAKQDQSLKKNLFEHGVGSPQETGRETLQRVSSQNVARLLPYLTLERMEKKISKDFELQALERLISQIQFYPVHNTNHIGRETRWWDRNVPLYSSKEISALGAKKWFRNTQEFNRNFMKSDDQVFFHIYLSFGTKNAFRSEYGSGAITIDTAYARKHAWVSAFVMGPKDLENFARRNLRAAHVDSPDKAKEQLHKFDFTWDDFSYFYKTSLLRAMVELKSKDPKKYQQALRIIESNPGSYEAIGTLRNLLPEFTGFEMKVPLAVPGNFVEVL